MTYTSQRESAGGPTVDRRDFVRVCLLAAGAVGLPGSAAAEILRRVQSGQRPSVIWLSFQECTGCTESLLRASHPALDELVLDLISLDYHEALCAGAGKQAEEARKAAMQQHAGQYVAVMEGAIPTRDGGIYCQIGGQTAVDLAHEVAAQAGAVIAIGSCASWGGLPSADPNPTGAAGVPTVLEGKTVVTIPGCPPNPYNFLGTVLQFATFGTLPALDDKARPRFAYGRTIHDDCPRRGHFDAGNFVHTFGDEAHREGQCLYLMGCKGPYTHANCSIQNFCDVPGAWPVGVGAPCIGCTEEDILWRVPAYQKTEAPLAARPSVPPLGGARAEGGGETGGTGGRGVNSAVAGVTGLIGGGLIGLGAAAAFKGRGGGEQPLVPVQQEQPLVPVESVDREEADSPRRDS